MLHIKVILFSFTFVTCKERQYKMVIVVNSQPQLSIGKTAAQAAHGAVTLFTIIKKNPAKRTGVQLWLKQGQPKIVLRGTSPDQMLQLKEKAKKLKLQTCIIHDAGRTEIESGTMTVLAIFGEERIINKVTSNLPLLK
ncbi:peptidyl-tRNA hydrolase 2, mitochondrial-like [Lycorma delicatula]|uniref:peptidyl-tRNA hydrolase 2, mitochondrial-like n=1 Tax=Lycorma delicatula TaxID=130591 RepID=UPI003F5167E7